ncbi:MAG: CBS domain-containing protein, partial [Anaerolineales bacterium]|nr:CBS domain-containing protein [Anaerolineales bacterium]
MSNTIQELYGRKGRNITDRDAQEITRVEELSYDLKIYEVMTRDVKSLTPGDTMQSVVDLLRQNRISGAPIMDGNSLVGIVSQEDL